MKCFNLSYSCSLSRSGTNNFCVTFTSLQGDSLPIHQGLSIVGPLVFTGQYFTVMVVYRLEEKGAKGGYKRVVLSAYVSP